MRNNVTTRLCEQFESAFGVKLAKEAGDENFANMYKKKFVASEIAQLCSDLVNGEEINL